MKKGIELAFSNIIVIVILLLFLIVMGYIIGTWGEQSSGILDRFFDMR